MSPRGSETKATKIPLNGVLVDRKETTEPQSKLVNFENAELESYKHEEMYVPAEGLQRKRQKTEEIRR
jgi:hypothetical protein